MDLANLRISVDSRGVRNATRDMGQMSRAGADAERKVSRSANRMTREFRGMEMAIRSVQQVLAAVAAVESARRIARIADEYANIRARLSLVTEGTAQLVRVQAELFEIAQRTSAEYASVAGLYTRVARSAEQLGATQQQLLQFTELTNQAFLVSGASTQEAAAAITQLTQGLAGGVLRGEEFNSVAEQGPRLMQALANALGVTIGQLRLMAQEGQLTADVVLPALLSQAQAIQEEFDALPRTVGRAATELGNAFDLAVANADVQSLIGGIDELKRVVTDPQIQQGIADFAGALVGGFAVAIEKASLLVRTFQFLGESAAAFINGPAIGDLPRIQDAIAEAERDLERALGSRSRSVERVAELTAEIDRLKEMERITIEMADAVRQVEQADNQHAVTVTVKTQAQIRDAQAARDRADAIKQANAGIDDQITVMRETIRLMEQGYELTEAQTRAELIQQGITDDRIEQFIEYTRILDRYKDKGEGAAEGVADAFDFAANRIQQSFNDVFRDILLGSDDVFDSILDGAKRLLVDLAAESIGQQVVPLLMGAGGDLFGSAAGLLGFAGAGASADDVGKAVEKGAEAGSMAGIEAAAPVFAAAFGNVLAFELGAALGERVGINPDAAGTLAVLSPELAIANLLTAGAVEALGNAAFGGEETIGQRGINLAFSNGMLDATQRTVIDTDGGWFGSDSSREVIDNAIELDRALNQALGPTLEALSTASSTLGISLQDLAASIDLNIKGMSDEEVQEALQGGFAELTGSIARQVLPNIESFRDGTETLGQTLQRVLGSTAAVATGYERLGLTLTSMDDFRALEVLGTELLSQAEVFRAATAETAQALVDASGGVQAFNRNLDSLIGFASEERQFDILLGDLERGLGELAKNLPPTSQGLFELFRTLGPEAQGNVLANIDLLDDYYNTLEQGEQAIASSIDSIQRSIQNLVLDARQIADISIRQSLGAFASAGTDAERAQALRELSQGVSDRYNAEVAAINDARNEAIAIRRSEADEAIDLIRQVSVVQRDALQEQAEALQEQIRASQDLLGASQDIREYLLTSIRQDPILGDLRRSLGQFRVTAAVAPTNADAARRLPGMADDALRLALENAGSEQEYRRIAAEIRRTLFGVSDDIRAASPEEQQLQELEALNKQLDALSSIQEAQIEAVREQTERLTIGINRNADLAIDRATRTTVQALSDLEAQLVTGFSDMEGLLERLPELVELIDQGLSAESLAAGFSPVTDLLEVIADVTEDGQIDNLDALNRLKEQLGTLGIGFDTSLTDKLGGPEGTANRLLVEIRKGIAGINIALGTRAGQPGDDPSDGDLRGPTLLGQIAQNTADVVRWQTFSGKSWHGLNNARLQDVIRIAEMSDERLGNIGPNIAAIAMRAQYGNTVLQDIRSHTNEIRKNTDLSNRRGYATGGFVVGPGTGVSDSIPAMLSNGEYVMRADAVSAFGVGFMDQLNAGRAPVAPMPIMYNNNRELRDELRALRKEVKDLREANSRENFAIAKWNAEQANSLDRLERDGLEVRPTDDAVFSTAEVA